MEKYDVYEDIAKRTDGDIYVGAVGPVRTGKSTFIRRFTETFLVPNIAGKTKRKIATDELPQSADGKTITTTEPKFVPSESVNITLGGKVKARMRLIDCVGFLVDGAIGHEEEGAPRLVKTPWNDNPIPFNEAAEIGTEKVITEHSTVGVVVTTDGSVAGIPRENYVKAEERTINKLKEIGKPFTIVLNADKPDSDENRALAAELSEKYGVSVVRMNVLKDGEEKFTEVMESVLAEFPLKSVDIALPDWLQAMPIDSKTISGIISEVKDAAQSAAKMKDGYVFEDKLVNVDKIIPKKTTVYAGEGRLKIEIDTEKGLFYETLSEACGENIDGDYKLMSFVRDLSASKARFDKVAEAVNEAETDGYGVVMPSIEDISVSSPEIVRKGTGYSVKIAAETECMHLIKFGVKADITPLSGTKKQCEDFLQYINGQIEAGGTENTNIFGRPIGSLIQDEINVKVGAMPNEAKGKVRRSVGRMVNDGKYRVFYIVY